jgi:hypothetical protein
VVSSSFVSAEAEVSAAVDAGASDEPVVVLVPPQPDIKRAAEMTRADIFTIFLFIFASVLFLSKSLSMNYSYRIYYTI